MSALNPRAPIIVGVGDLTDTDTPASLGRSPYDLIAQAARLALADTQSTDIIGSIDTVAMLRSYADTSHRFATRLGGSSNPPKSLADRLGLNAKRYIYTWNGGNMPQYLVNDFAEAISRGEMRAALVAGGEALRTQHALERAQSDISWHEDPGGAPELIGDPRRGWNDEEDRHGMRAAIAMYPLFENAIRGQRKASVDEHMQSMARLMARFADVARQNPLATRRAGWSAERLSAVDEENRWIGFPYSRFMVSNAFIDQAAAFIVTSVQVAQECGIPREKWVYLHGCADAHDTWYTSERYDLHSSPAMRAASRQALDMAGCGIGDIDILDIYSCFPSAVEIACKELGIKEDDHRNLTVTGGLVYFGGPGNSYVVLSICEMMRRLRAAPGKRGLITANGNWVTKHSYGIYSTTPPRQPWERAAPAMLQAELDRLPAAPVARQPAGRAVIETYTVMHDRSGPSFAIVLGRLAATNERFIANTPDDLATLNDLQARESLGRAGTVTQRGGLNLFTPD
ncbi:acetyl-CoA acetyltransferase [Paracandidimonas soli]|uniref:Acetyl-CoA C-acetyltransferase n=1 Tax=Paracandidimonas soli TaxID=1917182 RepID=A0A4V2VQY5_9BURK|nr:acetyl-CoA acetyltransferase [Paracandidimonas soli]TCU96079.1 acetyl-CoA C-acetyltransferase [Paracandidimonas soli]